MDRFSTYLDIVNHDLAGEEETEFSLVCDLESSLEIAISGLRTGVSAFVGRYEGSADVHHERSVRTVETHVQDLFSLDLVRLETLRLQFGLDTTVNAGQT